MARTALARASAVAFTGSPPRSMTPPTSPASPAAARRRRPIKSRADTPAAKAAQERRDNTSRIQEELEAVIPSKWFDMDEEERRGLDPRARTMVAARRWIEELDGRVYEQVLRGETQLEKWKETALQKGRVEVEGEDGDENMDDVAAETEQEEDVRKVRAEKCEECRGSGRSGGVGLPPSKLRELPDHTISTESVEKLRHLSTSLIRMAQAEERIAGGRLRKEVGKKIDIINKILVEAVRALDV